MSSHCKLKFSILWCVILINILISAIYGLRDFNQISVRRNLPASSEENIIPSKSSDGLEAGQAPKIRQYRKVNIHVQVMTAEPEFIGDIHSGLDSFVKESATEESGSVGKFHDNADVGPEYDVDDYFGEVSIGASNISDVCKDCIRKKIEKLEYHLMPAYRCDRWDLESRTCWLDRNIGGTVTFSLTLKNTKEKIKFPDVIWQQDFHILHGKDRIFFIITPDNLLWNTVISSGGHEFRISPISEMDVEPNRFSAFLADAAAPINKVHFKIRLIPIDLGFVYPGETFIINMDSYTSLPMESMAYVWYVEVDTETGILPSNMRSSPSGSVLTISELKKEQEGILSCSVFTNLGFLIARKRFLIQYNTLDKKRLNPSTDLKKPVTVSSPKKKKLASQLIHDRRFQTKRRDALSKAEKQLEAALLALQYHNAQRSLSEKTFEPSDLQDVYRKDNVDFGQDLRATSQIARQRLMPQFQHSANDLGFYNRVSSQQNIPEAIQYQRLNLKNNVRMRPKPILNIGMAHPDDQISMLIAECQRNTQCSNHAKCITQSNKRGFCRCFPNYRGNGISCWELE